MRKRLVAVSFVLLLMVACSSGGTSFQGTLGDAGSGNPFGTGANNQCGCPSVSPKCCSSSATHVSCVSENYPQTGCGGPTCDPCPKYPNSTAVCVNKACGIACSSGRANCDGDPANGCETQLTTDLAHCGGCNQPCAAAGATTACTSGKCKITSCPSGTANCNANVSDGCETSTLTDIANCGGCGIKCAGVCVAGACQSLQQQTLKDVATGFALSTNDTWPPCRLALDATNAYFATESAVMSVIKTGGTAASLSASVYPGPVAVDDLYVYFSEGSSVRRVPKAGGSATTMASQGAGCIALDATHVYFTGTGGVLKMTKGATPGTETPQLIGSGVGNGMLAVDATDAFWLVDGPNLQTDVVSKTSLAGGTAMNLYAKSHLWGLAIDAYAVYVAGTSDLTRFLKDGIAPTVISGLSVPSGPIYPKGIALDQTDVYVPTYDGGSWTMLRVPRGGGTAEKVVSGQGRIGTVTLDATHVYFVDIEGKAVRRFQK